MTHAPSFRLPLEIVTHSLRRGDLASFSVAQAWVFCCIAQVCVAPPWGAGPGGPWENADGSTRLNAKHKSKRRNPLRPSLTRSSFIFDRPDVDELKQRIDSEIIRFPFARIFSPRRRQLT